MDDRIIIRECFKGGSGEHWKCKFCGQHLYSCNDGYMDERNIQLDVKHVMDKHPFEYAVLIEKYSS